MIVVLLATLGAGATGLIEFTPQVWGSIIFFGGTAIVVVLMQFFPWERGKTKIGANKHNTKPIRVRNYAIRFMIGTIFLGLGLIALLYLARWIGGDGFLR